MTDQDKGPPAGEAPPVRIDMPAATEYAFSIIGAMPKPPVQEGFGSLLIPGLAIATVSILFAASKEDPRTMYATMKAYHALLTQFHTDVLASDHARRKQEGEDNGKGS